MCLLGVSMMNNHIKCKSCNGHIPSLTERVSCYYYYNICAIKIKLGRFEVDVAIVALCQAGVCSIHWHFALLIIIWSLTPANFSPNLQLAKRYYITFGLWYESSVCRLSVYMSVTLLHHRQRLELFGNICAPLIAQGLGQFVLKLWA